MLFAYLVAALGIPLPAANGKRSGERFPCENNPCGCATAEQCWKSCCCTTPEERIAWARENGVEPPSYAEQPSATCSHCAAHRGSCCKKGKDGDSKDHSAVKWMFGFTALKCQGHATAWTSTGVTVPPPLPTVTRFDEIIGHIPLLNISPLAITFTPPDPPPRSLAG